MSEYFDWEQVYKNEKQLQLKPEKIVEESIPFFKENNVKRILDLGCGTGRHSFFLADNGFEVIGLDYSKTAVEIAEKQLKGRENVSFVQGNMFSLPFENSSFDGLVCVQVLHHGKIIQIKKAVSEIHRVLKRGGAALISVLSSDNDRFDAVEIEERTYLNLPYLDGKVPHHFFTEKEAREFFKDFEIVESKHEKEELEHEEIVFDYIVLKIKKN